MITIATFINHVLFERTSSVCLQPAPLVSFGFAIHLPLLGCSPFTESISFLVAQYANLYFQSGQLQLKNTSSELNALVKALIISFNFIFSLSFTIC